MFTKTLNFASQIFATKTALESRIHLLRAIGGHPYGGQRKCLLNLFKSIGESKLFYAIHITARKGINSLKPLMPAYNSGVRIAAGAMRSSPIPSIHSESGTLPWNFRLTERLTTNAIRLLEKPHTKNTPATERSRHLFELVTGKVLPTIARTSYVGNRSWNSKTPSIDWSIKAQFKVGESSEKAVQLFRHTLEERYQNHEIVFTDGSVANGQVGFGVSSGLREFHFQLPNECSIFSAEAMAILYALRHVSNRSRYPTVIFSDSASVLAAVESGKSNHPWIQTIEQELTKLKGSLCWIPGHVGIEGNTKADNLAAKGRCGSRISTDVPAQDVKNWVKNELRSKWEQEWNGNRNLFLRQFKASTIPWKDRPNPLERRALTRLRIGHTVLTHDEYFTKGIKICITCNQPLTVAHIIVECRMYAVARQNIGISYNITTALQPANEEQLVDYLRSANILKKL